MSHGELKAVAKVVDKAKVNLSDSLHESRCCRDGAEGSQRHKACWKPVVSDRDDQRCDSDGEKSVMVLFLSRKKVLRGKHGIPRALPSS